MAAISCLSLALEAGPGELLAIGVAPIVNTVFRACESFHERRRSSRDSVAAGEHPHPPIATSPDTDGYGVLPELQ
jgi:hypothetical protein